MMLLYYILIYLKSAGGSGKQYRPWSDASFCGILSESTLFAQACQSHYLELLQNIQV